MSSWFEKWFGRTSADSSKALGFADARVAESLRLLALPKAIEDEQAWRVLGELDGRQLLDFDRAFRRYGSWRGPENRLLLEAAAATSDAERATAYRFAAACCTDGFLRQDALRELSGPTSRLAMAAAMIRSKDWVPEVRGEAESTMLEQLWSPSPELIFSLYDLYLLLERRPADRVRSSQELFEAYLLNPDGRDDREKATKHAESWIRRPAFELALRADADRTRELLHCAVQDRACSIALWALEQGRAVAATQPMADLLDAADRHTHPGVRAQSLRLRDSLDPDPQRLRAALLDRSRSVRDAAAYLLRIRLGEAALPIWRVLVDGGDSPDFLVAATALAEHAEPEDVGRLEVLFGHASARLRSMALHALVRLKLESLPAHLETALSDSSPRVLREATHGYQKSGERLNLECLRAAFASASTLAARIALLNAAQALSKWDSLAFLLERAQEGPAEFSEFLRPHLDHWYWHANSSYTTMPDGKREKLLQALEVARTAFPTYEWDRVRHMI